MKIDTFFNSDYINFASYDVYRKIANNIDGLKASSRKLTYALQKNNINKSLKVSQIASRASEDTQYLHGVTSLEGVLVSMAQEFPGTNNIPTIQRDGNFGNRTIPDASASRYIFSSKDPIFDVIYNPEDTPILQKQTFEGAVIEPKFYVPILPMILVNGANGISIGFRQIILQRNPLELVKIIKNYLLKGCEVPDSILPWFGNNYSGTVKETEPGSFELIGVYNTDTTNVIDITEIPIGYNLESYSIVLDKLVESEDAIKSYDDLSQDSNFHFKVYVKRAWFNKYKDKHDYIINKFKLIKHVTEQYYCLDDNQKIKEYSNVGEIFKEYINTRLEYYTKRKKYNIDRMQAELDELYSKIMFIKMVVDGTIDMKKTTTDQICKMLDKNDKIIKINDSYNYLLNMSIRNLCKDKIIELAKKHKDASKTLKEYKLYTIESLWLSDLEKFEKAY